jgi:hypothetical protein
MYQDTKGYANELESAFNGLHGRYVKLKEYYTVSDAENEVFLVELVVEWLHKQADRHEEMDILQYEGTE